jgi:diguanylate cyclase (GGDEF)-like protein
VGSLRPVVANGTPGAVPDDAGEPAGPAGPGGGHLTDPAATGPAPRTVALVPAVAPRRRRRISAWMPHGSLLRPEDWWPRHRAVLCLLAAHIPGLAAYASISGADPSLVAAAAAVPAVVTVAALVPGLGRVFRSCITAFGLMSCSAIVVYLSGGAIEAHFHFFVMVPVLALYEDWWPFGTGIGYVLVEHGIIGARWPETVYSHHGGHDHPWRFAAIHAGFLSAASIATLVQWRHGERARIAQQRLTEQLEYRARHDDITALLNRTALLDGGAALLADDPATPAQVGVLVLDLDRFKDVNDTLGHDHGDQLLRHVADCLGRALRDVDLLARLGGDEFAVVLPGADAAAAQAAARRLLHALVSQATVVGGVDVPVDASIGVAVSDPARDRDAAGMQRLLRHAEVAMYDAKKEQSGVALYDPERDANTRTRLALLADLRRAVDSEEILLHYQPAVRLSDERLVGAEALVRWNHPVLGMVPPLEFVPLAEATNLIVPLTHRVVRTALRQVREWFDAGLVVPVSVNVSPRSVIEGDLPDLVRSSLADHGVPPHLLRLEFTESTLVTDPTKAMEVLQALHDLGVGISLDDFGTGYSSLSYLKHLPVDELKVDRSFVAGLLTLTEDAVLVRATIDLGHNLGMTVVAEGVEDEPTAGVLRDLGCDVAQGYHYARPMAPADFAEWARTARRSLDDELSGRTA